MNCAALIYSSACTIKAQSLEIIHMKRKNKCKIEYKIFSLFDTLDITKQTNYNRNEQGKNK